MKVIISVTLWNTLRPLFEKFLITKSSDLRKKILDLLLEYDTETSELSDKFNSMGEIAASRQMTTLMLSARS